MAVRIGGELEQLDKQRQRAADAMFLITCYSEFCQGNASRLEALRQTGKIEDRIRCAVVARQLEMIARRTEGSNPSKGLIEKFSETLENDLLEQFNSAYKAQQWESMKVGYVPCMVSGYTLNTGRGVQKYYTTSMEGLP